VFLFPESLAWGLVQVDKYVILAFRVDLIPCGVAPHTNPTSTFFFGRIGIFDFRLIVAMDI